MSYNIHQGAECVAVHYHFLGIFGDDGLQSREQGSKVVKEQAGTDDPELKSCGNLPFVKYILVQVEKPRLSEDKPAAQSL